MSSDSVLRVRIHEGSDGIAIKLINLEKITLNLHLSRVLLSFFENRYSRIGPAGLQTVVHFHSINVKYRCDFLN